MRSPRSPQSISRLAFGLVVVALLGASCGDDDTGDGSGAEQPASSSTLVASTTRPSTDAASPSSVTTGSPSTLTPTSQTSETSALSPTTATTATTGLAPGATAPGATAPTAAPTATTAPPAPVGSVALRANEIARLDQPTALVAHPLTGNLAVTERPGRVMGIDGAGALSTILDLRDRVGSGSSEQGLLGIDHSADASRLFVHYTDRNGDTRVSEFRLGADGVADPASERILLALDQPFANHNGGQIAFGPDGYLYIGLGDGGSQGDPSGNGQRLDVLLGKILRIDPRATVDGTAAYTIPPDNPYASGQAPDGSPARPEIWAQGLRNPWRFSFDRATGDLYIADVGGGLYEEVDWQAGGSGGGQNYGWVNVEGPQEARPGGIAGTVLPIAFHHHDDGWCSITGGFVYRGTAIPGLAGTYVYGDYCREQVQGLRIGATGAVAEGPLDIGIDVSALSSLGEDLAGEIYLLSLRGPVYRLEAA